MASQNRTAVPGDDVITELGGLFVNMPRSLQKKMLRLAEQHDRTVQGEIRAALREHVDRKED